MWRGTRVDRKKIDKEAVTKERVEGKRGEEDSQNKGEKKGRRR